VLSGFAAHAAHGNALNLSPLAEIRQRGMLDVSSSGSAGARIATLAGQWVTTGSWTGLALGTAGSCVDVKFSTAGEVDLRFE